MPPPQVAEHVPQEAQDPSMQSTGQLKLLHVCDSEDEPQDDPPFCGCVKVLVLVCEPVPQVREHEPQEAQDPSMQSTGQLNVLHD